MEDNYEIEMLGITKEFPGIKANDNITLQLKKGEVHALLGENGAGKSTLMSILFGLYQADSGIIKKNGREVIINDPNDANDLGIGMVHQHFKLVDVFTVLENIILGAETTKFGFIDKKKARKEVVEISKKYGLDIDVNAKVEKITVGMQQRVEILKMLYRKNEILIFDEPTAVLTPQEINDLLLIMKDMAKSGMSILFISHKLNEILAVADRCTVLRKGQCVGAVNVKDTTKEQLAEMMVGRKVDFHVEKGPFNPKESILSVRNLVISNERGRKNKVEDISFDVRNGEIVCIAGIEGNGQTDLIHGITGLTKVHSGTITYKNVNITNFSIKKRNDMKISHIPEDRQKYGLILDFSLENNFILQRYFEPLFQHKGFMDKENITEYAEEIIEKYDVRSGRGPKTIVRSMSGGNQQKAIVGREITRNPDLLIACQPTRGLDIGAIEFIHKQIIKERDEGKAVLLMSLELDEIMDISDRILVMYEGKITGELDPKKISVEELGLYMSGAKKNYEFIELEEKK